MTSTMPARMAAQPLLRSSSISRLGHGRPPVLAQRRIASAAAAQLPLSPSTSFEPAVFANLQASTSKNAQMIMPMPTPFASTQDAKNALTVSRTLSALNTATVAGSPFASPCIGSELFSPKPRRVSESRDVLRKTSVRRAAQRTVAEVEFAAKEGPALIHISTCSQPRSSNMATRAVPANLRPTVRVETTQSAHVLRVPLKAYSPDEVTMTCLKGVTDGFTIAADKWDAAYDEECYLDYRFTFAPNDVRLAGIHARWENGQLNVTVPRMASRSN